MRKRREGWYWVRPGDEWMPALWNGVYFVAGANMRPEHLREIGPRIPTPDELWQCVPVYPHDAMLESGARALEDVTNCSHEGSLAIYHAMLKAAPSPGQEE